MSSISLRPVFDPEAFPIRSCLLPRMEDDLVSNIGLIVKKSVTFDSHVTIFTIEPLPQCQDETRPINMLPFLDPVPPICPICHDDLLVDMPKYATCDPCSHSFCFECIKRWVNGDHDARCTSGGCPVCRQNIVKIRADNQKKQIIVRPQDKLFSPQIFVDSMPPVAPFPAPASGHPDFAHVWEAGYPIRPFVANLVGMGNR